MIPTKNAANAPIIESYGGGWWGYSRALVKNLPGRWLRIATVIASP